MKLRVQSVIRLAAILFVASSLVAASAQSGGPRPGAIGPPPGRVSGPTGGPGPSGGPGAPGVHPPPPAGPGSPGANGSASGGVQFGPVGRWWDDKSVVQAVGLSKDQQKRMDSIFSANKPAILDSYKAFLREQSRLEALNKDSKATKEQVAGATEAVEKARATLQKTTAQMLEQIRQQMATDQITRLQSLR
ncbi:MAG: hypothetical protein P4K80_03935 [Acidobacteriaceae bacterium]|nr:hypothetical protein [Acidobacteriaceae bacterium]